MLVHANCKRAFDKNLDSFEGTHHILILLRYYSRCFPHSNRQSPSLCRFSFFDLVKGSWAPRFPSQTCLLVNPSSSWFLPDCLMLKGWATEMDMWCNLYFYLLRISTLVICAATFTTRRRPLRCNCQTLANQLISQWISTRETSRLSQLTYSLGNPLTRKGTSRLSQLTWTHLTRLHLKGLWVVKVAAWRFGAAICACKIWSAAMWNSST